jgi:heme/copper-type cytochrome/quinol oxidase subunit 1
MHRQARVYIKTAFVQLLISLFMGALLLINAGLRWQSGLNVLLPVYYHLLMVGWATQLIGGVALWMFPVHSRERPRGDERLGWIAYGALNGGLLIRAIAEPIHTLEPRDWSAWGLVGAALLQVCAVWILVVTLWSRVKGRSETRRPRPGDV